MKYRIKRTVDGFRHEPVSVVVKSKAKNKDKFDHKAVLVKSFVESLGIIAAVCAVSYIAKNLGII